jgi:flagellar hook-length control protein FliK
MTRIGTESNTIQRAQALPSGATNLRLLGQSGANAFGDLLAEKTTRTSIEENRPGPDNASTPASDTGSDANPVSDAAADEAGEDADTESSPDDTEVGNSNANETGESGVRDADAKAKSEQNEKPQPQATGTVGTTDQPEPVGIRVFDPALASGAASIVPLAAPVTGQDRIRQELKDPARIDLAALARQEQLGPPRDSAGGPGWTVRQGDQASSADRAPASPGPRFESAGTNGSAGAPTESEAGKPPPGLLPPPFRPEHDGTQGAASHTQSKTKSVPDHPLSAANPARGGESDGGSAANNARVEAAAARAAFLDRLANSGAARRGAVSAADKIIAVDRSPIGTEPKAVPQRPISFKPIDPPAPTRDAFLSPVQKGLGKMLAEGGGKLTVMLRPVELGDVRIAMETQRGSVRVKMEASSESARKVLESGLESLRSSLEARGVKVQSMEVTLSERADQSFEPRGEHQSGQRQQSEQHHADQRDGGAPGRGGDPRASQTEPVEQGGLTAEQTKRMWTELGIDAVA